MSIGTYVAVDGAVREDLMDVLVNISPTETQLVSGLGVTSANSTRHEWLQDSLAAVKTNAYIEGADTSYPTLTNPTRVINYTQIFRQGYKVSETHRAVDTAAFNDRYQYETVKALKVMKNDMELALMRGSIACGTNVVAGKLKGIKNWLSIVSTQSGVSLSEATLNNFFQAVWTQGGEIDAVYATMALKRRISSFTANNTRNIGAQDKRLVNAINIYEADAARMVKLFAHRYVGNQGGDVNQELVGLQEDMWKISYLRKPHSVDRPATGDFKGGEVIAEATLECRNGYAGFWLGQVL
jgi:hypothetical protein